MAEATINPREPIDIQAIVAQIDRDLAESRKLRIESEKLAAESKKLDAEAGKYRHEGRWVAAGAIGLAIGAASASFTVLIGIAKFFGVL